jgi:hypothetical protein
MAQRPRGGAAKEPEVSLKRRTVDQYPPSLMSPERSKEISAMLGKELADNLNRNVRKSKAYTLWIKQPPEEKP